MRHILLTIEINFQLFTLDIDHVIIDLKWGMFNEINDDIAL